ncbi:MAG: thiamine phosphate synthase [Myxococcota bacterium]
MDWIRRRGLYAIVDPAHCAGRDPRAVAGAILQGGCAVLQLRAKALADAPWLALARALRAMCAGAGVPFVLNDRPDLAVLAGADGLHLGRGDLPVCEARRIVGAGMAVGLSTHDEAQAREAVGLGADLIGFGPIFETTSKHRPDPVVGLDRLAAVSRECPLPVVAIGGIAADRAADVAASGASLVAAISAVCGADDPAAAARAFHGAVGGANPPVRPT